MLEHGFSTIQDFRDSQAFSDLQSYLVRISLQTFKKSSDMDDSLPTELQAQAPTRKYMLPVRFHASSHMIVTPPRGLRRS
jgi:hypothetical protein